MPILGDFKKTFKKDILNKPHKSQPYAHFRGF